MPDNNARTMKFIEVDFWSRPIYKCIETGQLWKDLSCGDSEVPDLYSCQNELDGEPEYPINPDLNIVFKTKYKKEPDSFTYQLLDRLRTDCEYYLGYGNRHTGVLWAHDEQGQIDKMKELYNSLPSDKKPEWLTYEQILSYEKQMVNKEVE